MFFFKRKAQETQISPSTTNVATNAAKDARLEPISATQSAVPDAIPETELSKIQKPKVSEKAIKDSNIKTSTKRKKFSIKQQIVQKKWQKQQKKEIKQTKKKKLIIKKQKTDSKPKDDFDIKNLDLDLPTQNINKTTELPETLNDSELENIDNEEIKSAKPEELIEAIEEIKTAIEKIKKQEKVPFFKRLFKKRPKEQKVVKQQIQETPEIGKVIIIQNHIKKSREALMKFDLETAKHNYLEIMKIYNGLNPDEKIKVYDEVKELYVERKSAEGLKG